MLKTLKFKLHLHFLNCWLCGSVTSFWAAEFWRCWLLRCSFWRCSFLRCSFFGLISVLIWKLHLNYGLHDCVILCSQVILWSQSTNHRTPVESFSQSQDTSGDIQPIKSERTRLVSQHRTRGISSHWKRGVSPGGPTIISPPLSSTPPLGNDQICWRRPCRRSTSLRCNAGKIK